MHLTIRGQPLSKMRARTTIRKNKVRTFDPQESLKTSMKWKLKDQYRANPITGAIEIELNFFLQPKPDDKNRNAKLWGLIPCTSKKDLDNMVKFILDCANKILYQDDSQITSIICAQFWDEEPRTEISIMKHQSLDTENLTPEEKEILNTFSPSQLKYFVSEILTMFSSDDFNHENFSKDFDLRSAIGKISAFSDEFYPIITKIHKIRAKRSHAR